MSQQADVRSTIVGNKERSVFEKAQTYSQRDTIEKRNSGPPRQTSGLDICFSEYQNRFGLDFFKDRIPAELLMKPKLSTTVNMNHILCMICQNVVNINTSYTCKLCNRPVCLDCYLNRFLKHDDSKQFQMPCLCIIDMPISKIQTKNVHQKFIQQVVQQLQFRCFCSDQCHTVLSYQSFTTPIHDHQRHCDYSSSMCLSCKMPVLNKDKVAHRYRCSELLVACKVCDTKVKAPDVESHMKLMHKDETLVEDQGLLQDLFSDNAKKRNPLKDFAHAMFEERTSKPAALLPHPEVKKVKTDQDHVKSDKKYTEEVKISSTKHDTTTTPITANPFLLKEDASRTPSSRKTKTAPAILLSQVSSSSQDNAPTKKKRDLKGKEKKGTTATV